MTFRAPLHLVPKPDPHVAAASDAIERIHLHRASERMEREAMQAMFKARSLGRDAAADHFEDAINSLIRARGRLS